MPDCSTTAPSLAALGRCYAAALLQPGLQFDMLFGPAYKGIPLVAATAIALAEHHGRNRAVGVQPQGEPRITARPAAWSAARSPAAS